MVFGLGLFWTVGICMASVAEEPGVPEGSPGCMVDEATRQEQLPFYPPDVDVTGKVTVVVWPDKTGMVNPPTSSDQSEGHARIVVSSRNRPLDRAALDAARGWHYQCPDGLADHRRWARVEIDMSPATTRPARPSPKAAIDYFPEWSQAAKDVRIETTVRDDTIVPYASYADASADLKADARYVRSEPASGGFASYSSWNAGTRTSETWWLRNDQGAARALVLLVRVDYETRQLTYGLNCKASEKDCKDFAGIVALTPVNFAVDRRSATPPGATR